MTEENYVIENALIEQKDLIFTQINDEHFEVAIAMLRVVLPVWAVAGYRYKAIECLDRLRVDMQAKVDAMAYQARSRKQLFVQLLLQVQTVRQSYTE